MSGESFIVEFIGVPGAGKSTLSHAVAAELRRRGEAVSEPTRDLTHRLPTRQRILAKLANALRALVRHPAHVIKLIAAVRRTGQRNIEETIRVAFNLVHIYGLLDALGGRKGIHLLDQGMFQALWSVDVSATADEGADPVSRQLIPPGNAGPAQGPADQVVVLYVPETTVLTRLQKRQGSHSHSRLQSEIGTGAFHTAYDAALRALQSIEGVIESASVEALRVDTPQGDALVRVAAEVATTVAAARDRRAHGLSAVPKPYAASRPTTG